MCRRNQKALHQNREREKKTRADNRCLLAGSKCENTRVWERVSGNMRRSLAIHVAKTCFFSAKSSSSTAACDLESSAVLPSPPLSLICAFVPFGGFKSVQALSRTAHSLKITRLFSRLISISSLWLSALFLVLSFKAGIPQINTNKNSTNKLRLAHQVPRKGPWIV